MAINPMAVGSLLMGGVGMAQQARQARAQAAYMNQAAKSLRDSRRMRNTVWNEAMAYEPMADAREGINLATERAGVALGAGLQRAGLPSGRLDGDTNREIDKFQAYQGALDPLRTFVATERAASTQRRLGALTSALSSSDPGELSSGWANLSSQMQPNMAGPMSLMVQGIEGLRGEPQGVANARTTLKQPGSTKNYDLGSYGSIRDGLRDPLAGIDFGFRGGKNN